MFKSVSLIQDDGYTFYQCQPVEEAYERQVPLKVLVNRKMKFSKPRIIHRHNLFDVYGENHVLHGKFKYLSSGNALVKKDGKSVVVGAQYVNPFLQEDRSYYSIVETFHRLAGRKNLSQLIADVRNSKSDGRHLVWRGKNNEYDAVVTSKWVSREKLWLLARHFNPSILQSLNKFKSGKVNAEKYLNAKMKFFQNLNVLRRARRVFHVVSGEIEYAGGATPYAMPLEQCGFAIDMYWLVRKNKQGKKVGNYYYRLAYGRSIPWVLYKNDAVHLQKYEQKENQP